MGSILSIVVKPCSLSDATWIEASKSDVLQNNDFIYYYKFTYYYQQHISSTFSGPVQDWMTQLILDIFMRIYVTGFKFFTVPFSSECILLLLLLHLITHPTKCYTNSKVRALSEKTNSEQVRLQVFRKSRWTNRQVPQFDRQHIPTAGTSNSKGSQTPIRPVARHNKIPTNSESQSRPTRDCWTLGAKSNKVSRSETFKTLEH